MNVGLSKLSNTDLQTLAAALRSGRVAPPYSALQVSRFVPNALTDEVRDALNQLGERGIRIGADLHGSGTDRAGSKDWPQIRTPH